MFAYREMTRLGIPLQAWSAWPHRPENVRQLTGPWHIRRFPMRYLVNRHGKQHYVEIATSLRTGTKLSAWRVGDKGDAQRRSFICDELPRHFQFVPLNGGQTMAAGPKIWTEERIAERFAQGRGQGSGDNYIPWVWVQEFPSKANQTRVPSCRLKRTIHTFSYLERAMHLWHEYAGYSDYREQLPMDRRITLGAAAQLGVRHPIYPKSHRPAVMMLDALVTKTSPSGKRTVEAWDAKPHKKLDNRRIRDKLKLHKAFCAYIGIEHSTFTESTLPHDMVDTLEWARGGLPIEDELLPYPNFLQVEGKRLLHWLRSVNHERSVQALCACWDQVNHFESGTSLRLFKLLLWTKKVYVRLDQPEPWYAQLPDQRFYMYQEDRYGALLH
jgi:hypothetical protein